MTHNIAADRSMVRFDGCFRLFEVSERCVVQYTRRVPPIPGAGDQFHCP